MQVPSLGLLEEHEVAAVADLDVEVEFAHSGRAGTVYLVDDRCHPLLLSFEVTIKVELGSCEVAAQSPQENFPVIEPSSEVVMAIDVAKLFLG